MQVVILAGGLGTRIREETEFRPKPMVFVGNKPILWHIMRSYAKFGHKEFVICLETKQSKGQNFVGPVGIEPTTHRLKVCCSTD